LERDLRHAAKVFDALSSELRVAVALSLSERPMRLNELSKALSADPSNLRKVLLSMEEAGLVVRREGLWHITPLALGLLSSIRFPKERPKEVVKWWLLVPPLIIMIMAGVQAVLQERPTYLLGGLMLALIFLGAGYMVLKLRRRRGW
jgi:DNA-binding transcriptional ArsR family regulator